MCHRPPIRMALSDDQPSVYQSTIQTLARWLETCHRDDDRGRMRRILLFLSAAAAGFAEVRSVTLAQVLDLAMTQSAEAALARLDERRAAAAVQAASYPFFPKIFAGSELAYSSGFPLSIEVSAPSILESRTIASVFNQPQIPLFHSSFANHAGRP